MSFLSTVGAKVICAKLKGTCAVAVKQMNKHYSVWCCWDRGLAAWCCHVAGARSPALCLEDLRPCWMTQNPPSIRFLLCLVYPLKIFSSLRKQAFSGQISLHLYMTFSLAEMKHFWPHRNKETFFREEYMSVALSKLWGRTQIRYKNVTRIPPASLLWKPHMAPLWGWSVV